MSTLSGTHGSLSDTRKKQSRKDEAIRKKIESELARKRTISTTFSQKPKRPSQPKAGKGTVAALKPSPPLTVPENITVSEASQLCAAKRTDCVLVVDDEEGLSGIFTAKDLAYRVTAEGLDPHTTPVSQIMTRSPMVTRDTSSATEALQLMVARHFRHLPVVNEDGNVVGLLDITKVFHEALSKVERSSSASEKLYNALAGVQSELELGQSAQAAAMLAYVGALREKTALPDLTTVMGDERVLPATVGPRTSVREVAKLMKERRTTAVCVVEPNSAAAHPRIAGIFTSKDVVLRVIAAGLDAGRCSVIRVMTPHPDTAHPTLTIHDALKKMHNGHYLNLPVVESDGRLVAIVDVLKLTYATLEQMNSVSAAPGENAEPEGGPMWGRFFDSIGDDNDSVISGSQSHVPTDLRHLGVQGHHHSPQSEVHPNDSASVQDDDHASAVDGHTRGQRLVGAHSVITAGSTLPMDDGTYVFKFKTPSGRTHRFQSRHDDVEHLREIVAGKLATDPFFTEFQARHNSQEDVAPPPPDPLDFHLSYTDADGDTVLITADHDVTEAVKIARAAKMDRVVLYVQGGKGWGDAVDKYEAGADKKEDVKTAEQNLPSPPPAKEDTVKVAEKVESEPTAPLPPPSVKTSAPVVANQGDLVFGIPKDLLLPASIGALAVVIIGVFTISRMTDRY